MVDYTAPVDTAIIKAYQRNNLLCLSDQSVQNAGAVLEWIANSDLFLVDLDLFSPDPLCPLVDLVLNRAFLSISETHGAPVAEWNFIFTQDNMSLQGHSEFEAGDNFLVFEDGSFSRTATGVFGIDQFISTEKPTMFESLQFDPFYSSIGTYTWNGITILNSARIPPDITDFFPVSEIYSTDNDNAINAKDCCVNMRGTINENFVFEDFNISWEGNTVGPIRLECNVPYTECGFGPSPFLKNPPFRLYSGSQFPFTPALNDNGSPFFHNIPLVDQTFTDLMTNKDPIPFDFCDQFDIHCDENYSIATDEQVTLSCIEYSGPLKLNYVEAISNNLSLPNYPKLVLLRMLQDAGELSATISNFGENTNTNEWIVEISMASFCDRTNFELTAQSFLNNGIVSEFNMPGHQIVFEENTFTLYAYQIIIPKLPSFTNGPPCDITKPGDFVVNADCEMASNFQAPEDVLVKDDSEMTISSDKTLDVDFDANNIIVEKGSKITIKSNGSIS